MTATCKEFVYGAEGSGLYFKIIVTEGSDGKLSATVQMIEGSMDLNALWFSDGDNTANEFGSTQLARSESALNMNGATYDVNGDGTPDTMAWDGVQKLSLPGLGTEGEAKSTFYAEGETKTFALSFTGSLDDLDYLGVRATSVNGEGSIKLIDEGECPPPPPPPTDDYPDDFPLSNATLIFKTTAETTDLDLNKDGYIAVKIDGWDEGKLDFDDYEAAILQKLADEYGLSVSDFLGAVLKGGNSQGAALPDGVNSIDFYAYGDDDPDADPFPSAPAGYTGDGDFIPGGGPGGTPVPVSDTTYWVDYPPAEGNIDGARLDLTLLVDDFLFV